MKLGLALCWPPQYWPAALTSKKKYPITKRPSAAHQPKLRTDYSGGQELTLEAALLLANSGSEQLSIQGETYLQSLIARDRAYSTFMPTINLRRA